MGAAFFIVLFLILAIFIRIAVGSMDRQRIESYVQAQGGQIISINWAPFGRGWFGEKNDRIYEVVYYDAEGNQHFATCKTSMWGGVYWTEDRTTHRKANWFSDMPKENRPGKPLIRSVSEPMDNDLATENERLKQQNERLQQELRRLSGEQG